MFGRGLREENLSMFLVCCEILVSGIEILSCVQKLSAYSSQRDVIRLICDQYDS